VRATCCPAIYVFCCRARGACRDTIPSNRGSWPCGGCLPACMHFYSTARWCWPGIDSTTTAAAPQPATGMCCECHLRGARTRCVSLISDPAAPSPPRSICSRAERSVGGPRRVPFPTVGAVGPLTGRNGERAVATGPSAFRRCYLITTFFLQQICSTTSYVVLFKEVFRKC
jgi:hypothetical protein